METTTMYIWISVIAGILQIMLFFKLWVMTSDIKKIKNIINNKGITKQAQIAFLKGNKEEAKDLLHTAIYTTLIEIAKEDVLQSDYLRELKNIDKIYRPICEKMNLAMIDLDQYKERGNLPI